MHANIISNGASTKVHLSGRLDYNNRQAFRDAAEAAIAADSAEIQFDLGNVDYIDSTALGILLVVRDLARRTGKVVILTNVNGGVKQILNVANFAKMFALA